MWLFLSMVRRLHLTQWWSFLKITWRMPIQPFSTLTFPPLWIYRNCLTLLRFLSYSTTVNVTKWIDDVAHSSPFFFFTFSLSPFPSSFYRQFLYFLSLPIFLLPTNHLFQSSSPDSLEGWYNHVLSVGPARAQWQPGKGVEVPSHTAVHHWGYNPRTTKTTGVIDSRHVYLQTYSS